MQHAIEQQLQPTLLPERSWEAILSNIEGLSEDHAAKTSTMEKRNLGQIFTPLAMARQLISLIRDFDNKNINYADPGTGTGILSAALLSRHAKEATTAPNSISAFETDHRLHSKWNQNFSDICFKLGVPSNSCVLSTDFYQEAKSILTTGKPRAGQKA